ncbi:winged helix-turn-helix domain-containing protein [Streptacidiphilus sp. N1-10]|uniref:Winged helix-turn-helix domain-containing protein n=1 Tax=Streptacidiphilus jeojiensis TaxID=3229225 RepID=A0ABV6XXT5_9ACTN
MGERIAPRGIGEPDQRRELRELLRRGAKDYGFATDGWTLARVRRVNIERFSVVYDSLSRVGRLLHRMGFTPQLPARRALEFGEDAVHQWVQTEWPKTEKGGRQHLDLLPGRGWHLATKRPSSTLVEDSLYLGLADQ